MTVLIVTLVVLLIVPIVWLIVTCYKYPKLPSGLTSSLITLRKLDQKAGDTAIHHVVNEAVKATYCCARRTSPSLVNRTFDIELREIVQMLAHYVEALAVSKNDKSMRVSIIRALGSYTRLTYNVSIGLAADITPRYYPTIPAVTVAPSTQTPLAVIAEVSQASAVPADIEALAVSISALATELSDEKLSEAVAEALKTTRYYFAQDLPDSVAINFVDYLRGIEGLLRDYRTVINRSSAVAASFDNAELLNQVHKAITDYVNFVGMSSKTIVQVTLREMRERMEQLASLREAAAYINDN